MDGMTIFDTLRFPHKSRFEKARFNEIAGLLCDQRSLQARCRKPWMMARRGPRLTDAGKAEVKRLSDERKYRSVKMGGIGRQRNFRKAGADKKTQAEWREWWRVKDRHSVMMCVAACDVWLSERGLSTKQTWRHTWTRSTKPEDEYL